ncbi:MAG: Bug family tripartite tricarboxylate transporter substrate binding protein [Bradyrhizobium sp.]|uniref:Tripartite tricarboxylate transporter substrate binding protein n=1 Tax=Caenimonas koreensis DSM 17982 TaxID=1121255 RepID=A0A844B4I5_9BURK|nr:tripartite tricarboxylate transporter substrate binding protein [Caenimonas koreensis]MRD49708.1 tripartite tricarboxylate transporter substrate binding protein [Caenimonas koreensis DSM 17982]
MNIETPPSPQAVSRRRLLAATAAAVGFGAVAPARAQAAWRPSGPVKLIVTFPPGGATDILTRMIAPGLAEYLRQTVVVENRPGATGSIGSGHVYAAPPDGTTLLIGAPDALSIFPKLSKTTYDPNKFVPLAPLGSTSFILLARPGLPATNLQELIALARKQRLTIANAGTGGSGHLVSIAFCQAAGIAEATHVPHAGMKPALQGLMGDHYDVMFSVVAGSTSFRSKLKFLGVTSVERVGAVPDVPTFAEQGLPMQNENWIGVLAPPQTPASVAAELAKAIAVVSGTPAYKAKASELGFVAPTMTHREFGQYYEQDIRKWSEVIRTSKVKLD